MTALNFATCLVDTNLEHTQYDENEIDRDDDLDASGDV